MLSVIIQREYYSRVKRKSFIIATLLMPLLMVALMALPALLAVVSGPSHKTISVIDRSEMILPKLQSSGNITFMPADAPLDSLKSDEDISCILVIGQNIVANPSDVTLYTRGAPSLEVESSIKSQLADIIEDTRLKDYNIENLKEIIESIHADVAIDTLRIDGQEDESTSSTLSYFTGLIMAFMLYMFIMLYGQMVMTSIIEEKNNRVLEIVVSSIDPKYLMMGKIFGVGLVALTQILIWGLIITVFSVWVLPLFTGSIETTAENASMFMILGQLTSPSFMLSLFGYLVIFLIGGYLFYSSIYAAIGSAVDNIQDASQLQTIAMVPIIFAFIMTPTVIQDPESPLAIWLSLLPITSPMVMMARIPFGIPAWQIISSIIILYLSFFGMIWVAAKIYRVGIFMYGKKPTVKDLIRWARYK